MLSSPGGGDSVGEERKLLAAGGTEERKRSRERDDGERVGLAERPGEGMVACARGLRGKRGASEGRGNMRELRVYADKGGGRKDRRS